MKPTLGQQESLKALLWENIKYQETYNEVYDHIISALEADDDNQQPFNDKVQAIIDADFGGLSQFAVMEKEQVKCINNQIAKKQMHFAAAFFRLPLIIYTTLACFAIYQLAGTKLLSIVLLIAICVMLAPTIIIGFRMLNNASAKKRKPSIKTNMFNQLGIYGVILYYAINPHLITDHLLLKAPDTLHLVMVTALVMFYLIFGLSFIRLYRSELKLKLAL
jgi:hypothetical protein